MNNEPYSVLMSVYYKENPCFLEKAIDSVMEQEMQTNDFVIVCDGELSADLYKVIYSKKARFDCINVIQLDKNYGLGKALSIGLLNTKNDFVMRMDSDDVCMPYRSKKQIPMLLKYDLVGGWISEFENVENNIIGIRKVPELAKDIKHYARSRNPFNHPSVAFKKSAVIDLGNYGDLLFFEDYDLWIRFIYKNKSIYNIQEVLVNMRSGKSMRARRGGKQYRQSLRTLRKRMVKYGIISNTMRIVLNFTQIMFSLLPIRVKAFLYKSMLRSKV